MTKLDFKNTKANAEGDQKDASTHVNNVSGDNPVEQTKNEVQFNHLIEFFQKLLSTIRDDNGEEFSLTSMSLKS